jgi:hypothetical protein
MQLTDIFLWIISTNRYWLNLSLLTLYFHKTATAVINNISESISHQVYRYDYDLSKYKLSHL